MPQDTFSKDGRESQESTRDLTQEENRGSADGNQQLEAAVSRDLEQQQKSANHLNVASHGIEEGAVTGSDVEKQEVSAVKQNEAEEHSEKRKKGKEEVVLQDRESLPTWQALSSLHCDRDESAANEASDYCVLGLRQRSLPRYS